MKTLSQKKIFQFHFLQFINANHIFSQILLDGGTFSGWLQNCLITYCHLPLNLTTYHLFHLISSSFTIWENCVCILLYFSNKKWTAFDLATVLENCNVSSIGLPMAAFLLLVNLHVEWYVLMGSTLSFMFSF